ncbi:hypothetical protein E2C01_059146 [Portunus trituberculatus]|uniref:Uncharacterized protein n=1 Tax=Portunus trituberculatus TaxID=210409 RepID=A0A5B7H1R4_PORTR|nr:hypothetical protein [Portunus trituberculatus]
MVMAVVGDACAAEVLRLNVDASVSNTGRRSLSPCLPLSLHRLSVNISIPVSLNQLLPVSTSPPASPLVSPPSFRHHSPPRFSPSANQGNGAHDPPPPPTSRESCPGKPRGDKRIPQCIY